MNNDLSDMGLKFKMLMHIWFTDDSDKEKQIFSQLAKNK